MSKERFATVDDAISHYAEKGYDVTDRGYDCGHVVGANMRHTESFLEHGPAGANYATIWTRDGIVYGESF